MTGPVVTVQPTSAAMLAAWSSGRLPDVELVCPDTWAVAMAIPGEHLTYSLAYLIRGADGRVHVVDPGWDSERNFAALGDALELIDRRLRDVATVTVTHFHSDHFGMAGRLNRESGAEVSMSSREQSALSLMEASRPSAEDDARQLDEWGVPRSRRPELEAARRRGPEAPQRAADRLLEEGDLLPIAGRQIHVVLAPGHTSGHICLVDSDNHVIFTGDHVLPTIYSGLGLGGATETNPIADYVASLDCLAPYDQFVVGPGHEFVFSGLAARRRELADHHLRRSSEVRKVLEGAPGLTTWEIAARVTWTAGWENLRGFHVLSALAQISSHVEYVHAAGSLQAPDGT